MPELIVAPRRQHSRKPDGIHQRIERLVAGPYLELFARKTLRGWDAWGNEVELFRDRDAADTRRRPSRLISNQIEMFR